MQTAILRSIPTVQYSYCTSIGNIRDTSTVRVGLPQGLYETQKLRAGSSWRRHVTRKPAQLDEGHSIREIICDCRGSVLGGFWMGTTGWFGVSCHMMEGGGGGLAGGLGDAHNGVG